jgi:dTDP-4-amino-4,6-dideoxygalactose transaminase
MQGREAKLRMKTASSEKPIYVTQPTLAPLADVTALLEGVWASGIMTHNGPLVRRFEKECVEHLGLRRMVAVSNGTIAIQMAIRAMDLSGEIITTPFTFVATINAILWERCTPVFVDIDPNTLNIDPEKIPAAITSKTVAILPVHVFGNPCEVERIQALANQYGLKVIYDAAHAVGVNYQNQSLLNCGDISATSFHATKMLNTAEGGACIASNESLHKKLQEIRFFGYNDDKEIVRNGLNGKLTEVHAAIGIANLAYLSRALDDRKKKYSQYKTLLADCPKLAFQKLNHSGNYSYFPIIMPTEATVLYVVKHLQANGVVPRRYFYPSVNTYTSIVSYQPMPISEGIASRIICLPLYYNLSEGDVDCIGRLVLDAMQGYR